MKSFHSAALLAVWAPALLLGTPPKRKNVDCHVRLAAESEHHPFSFWLANALMDKGQGPSWLAAKTSLSPASISRYLSAERLPPRSTLHTLADALDLPVGPALFARFRQEWGTPSATPLPDRFFPLGEPQGSLALGLSPVLTDALTFLKYRWELSTVDAALSSAITMLYRELAAQPSVGAGLELSEDPYRARLSVQTLEEVFTDYPALSLPLPEKRTRYSASTSVVDAFRTLKTYLKVDGSFLASAAILRAAYLVQKEAYALPAQYPALFKAVDPQARYSARKRSKEEILKIAVLRDSWGVRTDFAATESAVALLYWDYFSELSLVGYRFEALHSMLSSVCAPRGTELLDLYRKHWTAQNTGRVVSQRHRVSPALENVRNILAEHFGDILLAESLAIERAYQKFEASRNR